MKNIILMTLLIAGCGSSSSGGGGGVGNLGPINAAFETAARDNGIPVNLLKAVAYHESGLSDKTASSPYFQIGDNTEATYLGFNSAETAFGVSNAELGTTSEDGLAKQISAYGAWLKSKLDQEGISLSNSDASVNDAFQWAWQITKLQRPGEDARESVWPIYSKGILSQLNNGFFWQSEDEAVELKARSTKISLSNLEADASALLQNDVGLGLASVTGVSRLDILNIDTARQTPKKIAVIHCPLNISACIDLQLSSSSSPVKLGAHYIIPQNSEGILEGIRPYQVNEHEIPVKITNQSGVSEYLRDTVVVMLVGKSGRYVKGYRQQVDPTWFSSKQLYQMSTVIKSVCKILARKNPGVVNEGECRSIEGQNGITFYSQNNRPEYRWGDIADYNPLIFTTFLESSTVSGAAASFDFVSNKPYYNKNESIEIMTTFQPDVEYIRIERAVRCSNGKIDWEIHHNGPTRDNEQQRRYRIEVKDGGPNRSGQHFIRLMLYSTRAGKNVLTGWNVKDFFIKGYDPNFSPPSSPCIGG